MGVTPPFLMLNNNTDKVSKMKQTPRETREILERYNLVVEHLIQEEFPSWLFYTLNGY